MCAPPWREGPRRLRGVAMLEKIQDAPEAYLTDVLAPRVGRDRAKIRKDSTNRDRI
jgi:hypothetical protein